ncbi:VapE domain-containing protein [Qipengyuania flava]|uniref:VapE domain-containing protein n=1 Tax=Qipengyuania flava TaxID=192812 RepID=UPI00141BF30E|nr:VapE domain-containing protein [Qipengyuania flava]
MTRPDLGQGHVSPASLELMQTLMSGALGEVSYDEFTGMELVGTPSGRIPLDEIELIELSVRYECLGRPQLSESKFKKIVRWAARKNVIDSAREWLSNLPNWDGVKRIESFLPIYLGTADSPYHRAVGRYLWSGMVARIWEPGCKADMMPVLVGSQGSKKSTLLKLIAPTEDYCADVRLTDRSADLANTISGRSVLIWEDLQGITGRSDYDRVKAFLTRQYFETRSHAKRVGSDRYLSRYIVFGTSNNRTFLRDPDGHRRYLPFDAPDIDLRRVATDKVQFWAEAFHLVLERKSAGLPLVDFEDAERLAKNEYENYQRAALWVDDPNLHRWLGKQCSPFSTAEALEGIGFKAEATRRQRCEMADSLRQLGYVSKRTRVHGMANNQPRWHKS